MRCATPRSGERVLSVSLQPADAGFELAVADRGHGLPADAQAHLFESFYSTKPNGVGLGLSIVRTIVAAHGGRVAAAPRAAGGSVFTVWLPSLSAPAPHRAPVEAETRRPRSIGVAP
jgi:signal transduction histidine kinase